MDLNAECLGNANRLEWANSFERNLVVDDLTPTTMLRWLRTKSAAGMP